MKEKQNGINRRKRLSPDIEETMDNAVKTRPMGVTLSHKRDKDIKIIYQNGSIVLNHRKC